MSAIYFFLLMEIREDSNKKIEETLDYLDSIGIQMHSLLAMYDGDVIAEIYYDPFNRDTLHRMYSETKSITAIAIGILVKKGLVDINKTALSYFSEYEDLVKDENIRKATVRDLLMMKSPYVSTCYKRGSKNSNDVSTYQEDYVKSFFLSKSDRKPGGTFSYDTGASVILAKLVEKASGKGFMEFLYDEMFRDLGVKDAYVVSDPAGNPQGGSGLMMRPIDMLKIVDAVSRGGCGIIDEEFIKDAIKPLSDNRIPGLGDLRERRCGYGYQIWRVREDAFAFLGLGGQLAVSIPEKKISLVTTADTQISAMHTALIMTSLLNIADNLDPACRVQKKKRSVLALENHAQVRPLSGTYVVSDNPLNISKVDISFDSKEGKIVLFKDGKEEAYPFCFGNNKIIDIPQKSSSPALSSASITEDGALIVWIQFIGECNGGMIFETVWQENDVTLRLHLYGELMFSGYNGIIEAHKLES